MNKYENDKNNTIELESITVNVEKLQIFGPRSKATPSCTQTAGQAGRREEGIKKLCLRWPNTVFARAFADAIQHVHKDFKKQTCRQ